MLNSLPSFLPNPSPAAVTPGAVGHPRAAADATPGFAGLMQQQADQRLDALRLADQALLAGRVSAAARTRSAAAVLPVPTRQAVVAAPAPALASNRPPEHHSDRQPNADGRSATRRPSQGTAGSDAAATAATAKPERPAGDRADKADEADGAAHADTPQADATGADPAGGSADGPANAAGNSPAPWPGPPTQPLPGAADTPQDGSMLLPAEANPAAPVPALQDNGLPNGSPARPGKGQRGAMAAHESMMRLMGAAPAAQSPGLPGAADPGMAGAPDAAAIGSDDPAALPLVASDVNAAAAMLAALTTTAAPTADALPACGAAPGTPAAATVARGGAAANNDADGGVQAHADALAAGADNGRRSAAGRAAPADGQVPARSLPGAQGGPGAAAAGGTQVSAGMADGSALPNSSSASPQTAATASTTNRPSALAHGVQQRSGDTTPALPGAGAADQRNNSAATLAASAEAGPASLSPDPAGLAAAAHAPLRGQALAQRGEASAQAQIRWPVDSPAFAPALGAQISVFARDGVQTALLQLSPAEMGPITVQITMDGNAAQVQFQADRSDTRAVIEASLPALAGALQDAGLTLTGGGVSQQHPGRQPPPEPAAAAGPRAGAGPDSPLARSAAGAAAHRAAPRGLVDLVA